METHKDMFDSYLIRILTFITHTIRLRGIIMENIQENSDQFYLEKAPVKRAILHLSIPMMLGMSVGVIFNIINAFFLGLIHDTAMLSAVTFGLPITALLVALGSIWGVGGGTFISRLLGAGNREKIKPVASLVMYGSLIFGIIIVLFCLLFLTPIIKLLGTDPLAYRATHNYVLCLFLVSPFIICNFTVEQMVRAEGAAKESMIGMIINTAVNLIFDVLFILILQLNVVGAALSFGLSNLSSLAYYLWHLQKRSPNIDLSPKFFSLDRSILKEVLGVGMSDFMLTICTMISALMLNNYAVRYGDNVIAAFGVSLRIVQLPEFLCMGLFMGVIPLLAFAFGAQNKKRLLCAMTQTTVAIALIVGVFSTLVFLFREDIFHLFTTSGSLIQIGVYILGVMLISTTFNGFTGLITSYFQATGKAKPAFAMAVTRGIAIIPTIILANSFLGLDGVIFSMPIAEFITFLLGLVLYFSRKKINAPDYTVLGTGI